MYKYYLLESDLGDYVENDVGIRQWVKAMHGSLLQANDIDKLSLDQNLLLTHIRLTSKNFAIINDIRRKYSHHSNVRIIISLDLPIELINKEFFDLALLSKTLACADLIFATDYSTCLFLRNYCQSPVFEIAHPADINNIKRKSSNIKDTYKSALILGKSAPSFGIKLMSFFAPILKIKIFRLSEAANDQEIVDIVKNYSLIISLGQTQKCKKIAIYSAAMGRITLGNSANSSNRKCYPFSLLQKKPLLLQALSLKFKNHFNEFIRDFSLNQVNFFNLSNSRDRLLSILNNQFPTHKNDFEVNPGTISEDFNFKFQINHISGPSEFRLDEDQFVVLCTLRNGEEYLPSFLRHYKQLGASHFIFIDNGSTDNTLKLLASENATIYQTFLSHKDYENEIKRTILEKQCRFKWVMCVDIDELFEYPCSELINMKMLLKYLKTNNFNALMCLMLDMFSMNHATGSPFLEDNYQFYDTSKIKQQPYLQGTIAYANFNKFSKDSIYAYYGGVRQKYVKNKKHEFLLIKHPLFYFDEVIEPFSHPHFCNKAAVADLTGILKHYKLTSTLANRIHNGNPTSLALRPEANAYSEIIKNWKKFPESTSPKLFKNLEPLIKEGLVKIPPSYLR